MEEKKSYGKNLDVSSILDALNDIRNSTEETSKSVDAKMNINAEGIKKTGKEAEKTKKKVKELSSEAKSLNGELENIRNNGAALHNLVAESEAKQLDHVVKAFEKLDRLMKSNSDKNYVFSTNEAKNLVKATKAYEGLGYSMKKISKKTKDISKEIYDYQDLQFQQQYTKDKFKQVKDVLSKYSKEVQKEVMSKNSFFTQELSASSSAIKKQQKAESKIAKESAKQSAKEAKEALKATSQEIDDAIASVTQKLENAYQQIKKNKGHTKLGQEQVDALTHNFSVLESLLDSKGVKIAEKYQNVMRILQGEIEGNFTVEEGVSTRRKAKIEIPAQRSVKNFLKNSKENPIATSEISIKDVSSEVRKNQAQRDLLRAKKLQQQASIENEKRYRAEIDKTVSSINNETQALLKAERSYSSLQKKYEMAKRKEDATSLYNQMGGDKQSKESKYISANYLYNNSFSAGSDDIKQLLVDTAALFYTEFLKGTTVDFKNSNPIKINLEKDKVVAQLVSNSLNGRFDNVINSSDFYAQQILNSNNSMDIHKKNIADLNVQLETQKKELNDIVNISKKKEEFEIKEGTTLSQARRKLTLLNKERKQTNDLLDIYMEYVNRVRRSLEKGEISDNEIIQTIAQKAASGQKNDFDIASIYWGALSKNKKQDVPIIANGSDITNDLKQRILEIQSILPTGTTKDLAAIDLKIKAVKNYIISLEELQETLKEVEKQEESTQVPASTKKTGSQKKKQNNTTKAETSANQPYYLPTNQESTGQLAMQLEGVKEASWDIVNIQNDEQKEFAETKYALDGVNYSLENQIELLDFLKEKLRLNLEHGMKRWSVNEFINLTDYDLKTLLSAFESDEPFKRYRTLELYEGALEPVREIYGILCEIEKITGPSFIENHIKELELEAENIKNTTTDHEEQLKKVRKISKTISLNTALNDITKLKTEVKEAAEGFQAIYNSENTSDNVLLGYLVKLAKLQRIVSIINNQHKDSFKNEDISEIWGLFPKNYSSIIFDNYPVESLSEFIDRYESYVESNDLNGASDRLRKNFELKDINNYIKKLQELDDWLKLLDKDKQILFYLKRLSISENIVNTQSEWLKTNTFPEEGYLSKRENVENNVKHATESVKFYKNALTELGYKFEEIENEGQETNQTLSNITIPKLSDIRTMKVMPSYEELFNIAKKLGQEFKELKEQANLFDSMDYSEIDKYGSKLLVLREKMVEFTQVLESVNMRTPIPKDSSLYKQFLDHGTGKESEQAEAFLLFDEFYSGLESKYFMRNINETTKVIDSLCSKARQAANEIKTELDSSEILAGEDTSYYKNKLSLLDEYIKKLVELEDELNNVYLVEETGKYNLPTGNVINRKNTIFELSNLKLRIQDMREFITDLLDNNLYQDWVPQQQITVRSPEFSGYSVPSNVRKIREEIQETTEATHENEEAVEQLTNAEKKAKKAKERNITLQQELNACSQEAIDISKKLLTESGFKPRNDLLSLVKLATEWDNSHNMDNMLGVLAQRFLDSKNFEYLKEIAPITYEILSQLQSITKLKYNKEDVEAFGDAWSYVQRAVGKTKMSLKDGVYFDQIDFPEYVSNEIYKETNDIVSGISSVINKELDLVNGTSSITNRIKEQFISQGLGQVVSAIESEVPEVKDLIIANMEDVIKYLNETEITVENICKLFNAMGKSSFNFSYADFDKVIGILVNKTDSWTDKDFDEALKSADINFKYSDKIATQNQMYELLANNIQETASAKRSEVLTEEEEIDILNQLAEAQNSIIDEKVSEDLQHQSSMYENLAGNIQETSKARNQAILTEEEELNILNQMSAAQSEQMAFEQFKFPSVQNTKFYQESEQDLKKDAEEGIQLMDTLNRVIDETNAALLEGTKIVEEGTGRIKTLFYYSTEVSDKLSGGLAGKSFSTIPMGLKDNEKMTQWYANLSKVYTYGDGFDDKEIKQIVDKYFYLVNETTKKSIIENLKKGDIESILKSNIQGFIGGKRRRTVTPELFYTNILQELGYQGFQKDNMIQIFDLQNVHRANQEVIQTADGIKRIYDTMFPPKNNAYDKIYDSDGNKIDLDKQAEGYKKVGTEIMAASENFDEFIRKIQEAYDNFEEFETLFGKMRILRSQRNDDGTYRDTYEVIPNFQKVEYARWEQSVGFDGEKTTELVHHESYIQTYEQLEKQAIAVTNELIKKTAELNLEKSKGANADQNRINLLVDYIGFLGKEKRQLDLIARILSSQKGSDFTMNQYEEALRKGTEKQGIISSGQLEVDKGKYKASVEKVYDSYSAKLEQFKSTNKDILSGLTTPLQNMEAVLYGLMYGQNSISEVQRAFLELKKAGSEISSEFQAQLSKEAAGFKTMKDGSANIIDLRRNFEELGQVSVETEKKLAGLETLLRSIKKEYRTNGATKDFAKGTRDFKEGLSDLKNEYKSQKDIYKIYNALENSINSKINDTSGLKSESINNSYIYLLEQLEQIKKSFLDGTISIEEFDKELRNLAQLIPIAFNETDQVVKLYTELSDLEKEIVNVKSEINDTKAAMANAQASGKNIDLLSNKLQELGKRYHELLEQGNNLENKRRNLYKQNALSIGESEDITRRIDNLKDLQASEESIIKKRVAEEKLANQQAQNEEKQKQESIKATQKAYEELLAQQTKIFNMKNQRQELIDPEQIKRAEIELSKLKDNYQNLQEQFKSTYGQNVNVDQISDNYVSTRFSTLVLMIEKYSNEVKKAGGSTNELLPILMKYREALDEINLAYSATGNIEQFTKDTDILANEIQSLFTGMNNDSFSKFTQLNKMLANMEKVSFKANKDLHFSDEVSLLRQEFNALFSNWTGGEKQIDQLEKLMERVAKLRSNATKYKTETSKGTFVDLNFGKIEDIKDLTATVEQYFKSYQNVTTVQDPKNVNGLIVSYSDLNGKLNIVQASFDSTTKAMRIQNITTQEGQNLNNAFVRGLGSLAKSLLSYYTGYTMVMRFVSAIKEGVNYLKEYDVALNQMSYTMNLDKTALNGLGENARNLAEELSVSLDNAMKIYQIYANMKTTVADIEKTGKPTAILANLAGIDASTAADEIQGVMNQFNKTSDDAMHIVDVYDYISSQIAVDYSKGIEGMAAAVENVGNVAYQAGLNFEQLSSIVATTIEQTRAEGSQVGNALKTILVRVSKASTMAEEVDNETLSKASKALHDVGVEVYTTSGEFREFDVIMTELSKKWDSLTDAQQANISYQVAATRQTATLKAILQNWERSEILATEAVEANGNALENQAKYEESYVGKLQQISNLHEEFWLQLLNNDITKGLLDFWINVLSIINKIPPILAAIASFAGVLSLPMLKELEPVKAFFAGTKIGIMKEQTALLQQLVGKTVEKTAATNADTIAERENTEAILENSAAHSENLATEQADIVVDEEHVVVENADTIAENTNTKSVLANTKAVVANIAAKAAAHPVLTIAVGLIAAVSAAILYQNHAYKKNKEAVEEATTAIDEFNNTVDKNKSDLEQDKKYIDEIKWSYIELSKHVNTLNNTNIDLSEDEFANFLEINNKLADMFPSIITGFDDEGNAIINLGNNAEETSKKLQELIDKEDESNSLYIRNNIKDTTKNLLTKYNTKDTGYNDQISKLERDLQLMEENLKIDNLYTKYTDSYIEKLKSLYGDSVEGVLEDKLITYTTSTGEVFYDVAVKEVSKTYFAVEKYGLDYIEQVEKTWSQYMQEMKGLLESEKYDIQAQLNQLQSEVDVEYQEYINNLFQGVKYQPSYVGLDVEGKEIAKTLITSLNNGFLQELDENSPDPYGYIQQYILNNIDEIQTMQADTGVSILDLFNFNELPADQLYTTLLSIQAWVDENGNPIGIPWEFINIDDQLQDTHNKIQKKISDLVNSQQNITEESGAALGLSLNSLFKDRTLSEQMDMLNIIDNVNDANEAFNLLSQYINQATIESEELIEAWDTSEMISQLTELSDGFDQLDNIMADQKDGDVFDFTKLDKKKFEETFSGFEDEYNAFIKAVSASPNELDKASQEAYNTLISKWVEAKGVLKQVTEETSQVTKDMLTMYGVTNAESLVDSQLVSHYADVAEACKKFGIEVENINLLTDEQKDKIADHIISLGNWKNASYELNIELAKTVAEKVAFNSETLNTVEGQQALINLMKKAGATAEVLDELGSVIIQLNNLIANSGNIKDSTAYNTMLNNYRNKIQEIINKASSEETIYGGGDQTNKTTSSGGSSSDKWLEEYKDKMSMLKDMRDRDLISGMEYYEKSQELMDQYLKDTPEHIEKYAKEISEAEKDIQTGLTSLFEQIVSDLNSDIDNLQSAFSSVTKAIEEYNESGHLSIDTVQELLKLEPQYLSMLFDENGQLQLNESAYQALARAKMEEMKIGLAYQMADTISNLQTEAQAAQFLAKCNRELAKSTLSVAEAYLKSQAAMLTEKGGIYAQVSEMALQAYENQVKLIDMADYSATSLLGETKNDDKEKDEEDEKNDAYNEAKRQLEHLYKMEQIDSKEYYERLLSLTEEYYEKGSEEMDGVEESIYGFYKDLNIQDWIETKIEKVADKINKSIDKIDNYISVSKKNAQINDSIKLISKRTSYYEKAYKLYMEKADSVGLMDYYKSKVQSGLWELEEITNDKLERQIKNYSEWYDKAQDIKEELEELYDTQRDLIKQKLDNLLDQYETVDSYLSSITAKFESFVKLNDDMGKRSSLTELVEQFVTLNDQLNSVASIDKTITEITKETIASGTAQSVLDAEEKEAKEKLSGLYDEYYQLQATEETGRLKELENQINKKMAQMDAYLEKKPNIDTTKDKKYLKLEKEYEDLIDLQNELYVNTNVNTIAAYESVYKKWKALQDKIDSGKALTTTEKNNYNSYLDKMSQLKELANSQLNELESQIAELEGNPALNPEYSKLQNQINEANRSVQESGTYQSLLNEIEIAENKIAALDDIGYDNLTKKQKLTYDKLTTTLNDYYEEKKELESLSTATSIATYQKYYRAYAKLVNKYEASGKDFTASDQRKLDTYLYYMDKIASDNKKEYDSLLQELANTNQYVTPETEIEKLEKQKAQIDTDLQNTQTYQNLVNTIKKTEDQLAKLDYIGYDNLTKSQKNKYNELNNQLEAYYEKKDALDKGATASNVVQFNEVYNAWKKLQDKLNSGKNLSTEQWQNLNSYEKQLENMINSKTQTITNLNNQIEEIKNPGDKLAQLNREYEQSSAQIRNSYQSQVNALKNEVQNTQQYKNLVAQIQKLEQKRATNKKGLSKDEESNLAKYKAELEALDAGATESNLTSYIQTWEAWYKLQSKLANGKTLSSAERKNYDTYKAQLDSWSRSKQNQINELWSRMEDDLLELNKTFTENSSSAAEEINEYYGQVYELAKQIAEYNISSLETQLTLVQSLLSYYSELADLYNKFSGDKLNTLLSDLGFIDSENEALTQLEAYELQLGQLNKQYDLTKQKLSEYQQLLDALNSDNFSTSLDLFNAILSDPSTSDATKKNLNEVIKLLNERAKSSKDWEDYADQWANEWSQALDEAKKDLISIAGSVQDVNDAIRQLNLKPIEDAIIELSRISSTLEKISGLYSDDWLYNDETGELTEQGIAKITMLVDQMQLAKDTASKYAEEYEKIVEMQDSFSSTEEYESAIDSIKNSYLDAVSSVKGFEEQIASIMIKENESVINSIKELISKRIEALQAQKELYEYNKSIANSQKEIDNIQAQIDAMENLTNATDAATKAKLAQLKAELEEKQEALDDTKQEHTYTLQINALNELSENLDEMLNSTAETINLAYDKFTNAIKEALEIYNANNQYLDKWSNEIIDTITGLADGTATNVSPNISTSSNSGISTASSGLSYVGSSSAVNGTKLEAINEKLVDLHTEYVKIDPSSLYPTWNVNIVNDNISEHIVPIRSCIEDMSKQLSSLTDHVMNTGVTVNLHYDTLMNVEGNIDKDFAKIMPNYLEESCEYTKKNIYKELKQIGGFTPNRR